MAMDLTFIRQKYEDKGLDKEDLNADPIIQFKSWFEDAKKSEPIPTAMSLSTVNNNGEPTLRTVLKVGSSFLLTVDKLIAVGIGSAFFASKNQFSN